MPKELVPYSWVQQPCLFLQHCQGDLCRLCERPFTFINRPRHCDFCGHVFHRKDCSRREGGRALGNRVCYYCDDYRTDMRERLQNGYDFVCVSNHDDLFLSLCEETAELVLHWKSKSIKETVDLLQVELRKGFTHGGHLHNGDYEPLKSMSLFIRESQRDQRVLDLKAASAWTCQMWVDGLKSTQYVYQCMQEQERARLAHVAKGVKLPDHPGWFTKYYLPDNTPTTSPSTHHTPTPAPPTPAPPTHHTPTPAPPTHYTPTPAPPMHYPPTPAPSTHYTPTPPSPPHHTPIIPKSRPSSKPVSTSLTMSTGNEDWFLERASTTPTHTDSRYRAYTESACTESGYSSESVYSSTIPARYRRRSRPQPVRPHSLTRSPSFRSFTQSPVGSSFSPHPVSSLVRSPPHTQSWHSVGPPFTRTPHTTHTRHTLPHSAHHPPYRHHSHSSLLLYSRPSRGLPYHTSPLSSLCRCHDYEVVPSRSVDCSPRTHVRHRVSDGNSKRCCNDCIRVCKIAQDLDNL